MLFAELSYRDLPAANALLNALAGVLLFVGVRLIRQGREATHKRMMLAAFAVSVVFLGCYLTYHQLLFNNEGSHGKPFTGPQPIRGVYFALLISAQNNTWAQSPNWRWNDAPAWGVAYGVAEVAP